METIWQEVRLAVRGLRRAPGYTVVAVVTLALGIGATAAIYTGVEAALLRPLPYAHTERLVHLWETSAESAQRQLSYPDYLDIRDGARSFSSVAGYGFFGATLRGPDGNEVLSGARVSANFFTTLGIVPVLGRSFAAEEDQPGRTRDVVVLSHGAWQRRFGADPAIVGRQLELSGAPYTVIGVLPRAFQFARLGDPELFVTLSPSVALAERRFTHWMWGVGRLAPGVGLAAADAELATLAERRAREDPRWHGASGLDAMPLREAFVGNIRPLLLGLLGGVAAVLLIACANVANMALARATGREREVGLRIALGVGRWRLVRQFLVESLLVALAGGAIGVVLSLAGTRILAAAVPAERAARMPFLSDLQPRAGVILFTLAICLVATVAIGLVPALRSRHGLAAVLRDGARGATARSRLRELLLVGEIALALVLVSAAGLMTRSLDRLLSVDAGFDRQNVLTAFVALPRDKFDSPEEQIAGFDRLSERLVALPGVRGVAWVDRLPLTGSGNTGTPTVVGRAAAGAEGIESQMRTVSDGYFDVLGVPLIAGRKFDSRDRVGAPPVVMVNRRLATALFPSENPVGQRFQFVFLEGQTFEVVGVVGNELVTDLDAPPEPAIYFPASQDASRAAYLVVRSEGRPESLARPMAAAVRDFEPGAVVSETASLEQIVADTPPVFLRRFPLLLLRSFAGLALLLSGIGVYGVMAYFVGQRTREIGIRVAIGARAADVQALVLRRGAAVALGGAGGGLAAAWWVGRLLTRLLFHTSAADPLVLGAATATLVALALVACLVPAWRASRVDPVVALRHD